MLKELVLRVLAAALVTASGELLLPDEGVTASARRVTALIGTVMIIEKAVELLRGGLI